MAHLAKSGSASARSFSRTRNGAIVVKRNGAIIVKKIDTLCADDL